MMHYIISIEISKRVAIDDLDRFVIGTLVPDASSHSDGSYNVAHFEEILRMGDVISRGINWTLFETKYQDKMIDSLYIGYLCHLITDAIWFYRITDKYIRIYPKSERTKYIERGYRDFQILNKLLQEKYSVIYPSFRITPIEIDEICVSLVEPIVEEFKNDFEQESISDNEILLVYPFEDILAFIEESVEVCVQEICALRHKKEKIQPYRYYTEPRT